MKMDYVFKIGGFIIFIVIFMMILSAMSIESEEVTLCKNQCDLNKLNYYQVKIGAYNSFEGCYCKDGELIKRIY